MDTPTRDALTLTWLVRLRWAALVGQIATVAIADRGLGLELPYAPLVAIVALTLASNLALWARRPSRRVVPAVVVGDTLLLTGLLALTGGPSNPFSALYLVHVALAAVALGPRWTWAVAALSAASYGLLFLVSDIHLLHRMDAATMSAHLVGMWAALTLTGGAIAVFVATLAHRIAAREAELDAERRRAERAVRLAALGTLAGGAAHELGSPLGAIAVAAEEAHGLAHRRGETELAGELAFIQGQVARCREILADLASGTGQSAGEVPEALPVAELWADAQALVGPAAQAVALVAAPGVRLRVPRRAAARVLASLVRNGLAAGGAVRVEAPGGGLLRVVDAGEGMAPEVLARAGEPFFTTRAAGEGMGLGLFLARGFAESLGGRLSIASVRGKGTTVTLHLPEAS